ncbi:SDR family oxidoreductase [Tessaracoccus sp. MC1865]|uniref:SDR family oxidoreductase n=1 Tax=unclassified Tessaracoccus TaxID=2635419 RepID=UPI0015FEF94C|nr:MULTISPECIES: SDR family oxidoreductase [unclassified Tessaracoccus]MBB1484393.1 SDR family oxidoreductase [Tessaracoccus sp. MC1865]MBB1509259.1 SDR family oxidoreductase [Tessaracoccus sp. MC1756]QTO38500.1 SDR family oxidoreductase [Tessaracoccus sp. MC1865]
MKICIIGGHGKIALLLHPLLVQGGHEVAALIRNPAQVSDVEETGARAVVADVENLDTDGLAAQFDGLDAVIWSAGAGGGNPERTYAVDRDAAMRAVDAALQAGVWRFVMVSYVGSGVDDVPEDNPFHHYAVAKADADQHLRASSLNWTIVAPGQLTEEPATGKIEYGDHVLSGETSRGNVAQLVAAVVGRADLPGITIRFRDGVHPVGLALDSLVRRNSGQTVNALTEGVGPQGPFLQGVDEDVPHD